MVIKIKLDLNRKLSRGALRTLKTFSDTLFKLLTEKAFENITVNEICEEACIPRATFYNYFDDKYDLMSYCWYTLTLEIHIEDYKDLDPDKRIHVFFDRMCDLLIDNHTIIQKIIQNNPNNSWLLYHFRNYFYDIAMKLFHKYPNYLLQDVPDEIVANHFCNTILLIFEWCFFHKNTRTKEEARKYLDCLLGL